KLEQREAIENYEQSNKKQTASTNDDDFYINQKQQKKEKRKLERQLEEIESNISEYESLIEDYEYQLNLPEVFNDIEKSNQINKQSIDTEHLLEESMNNWEEIQNQLD